jgi:hypothetical protein
MDYSGKLLPFVKHDGGRAAAGFKGKVGDCATRAIAIAAQLPYLQVYDRINAIGKQEKRREAFRSTARNGVSNKTIKTYMKELGWTWVPTMSIGSGCHTHLRPGELPMRRLVVRVSKHVLAVIDGVMYDDNDPSRGGTRCVYGYYYLIGQDHGT